jgi:hypothetical protein
MRSGRFSISCACIVGGLALAGCATHTDPARAPAAPLHAMRREDTLWLERASFGLDSASVESYQRLGREQFLDRQLHPGEAVLPAPVAKEIATLEVSHADPVKWLADVNAQNKLINAMPEATDKEQARKVLNDRGNKLAYEAIRRDLLREV